MSKWPLTSALLIDTSFEPMGCDCKLFDMRHCRKCAFTNLAYVDPNMESIFEFNNLRLSPEMFCHIYVIKDDSRFKVFFIHHILNYTEYNQQ